MIKIKIIPQNLQNHSKILHRLIQNSMKQIMWSFLQKIVSNRKPLKIFPKSYTADRSQHTSLLLINQCIAKQKKARTSQQTPQGSFSRIFTATANNSVKEEPS